MKKKHIVNFLIISWIIFICTINISARSLNIRSAYITSVEYSTGNDEWYTEDELKSKEWNITNVYIKITCDLGLSDDVTYQSIDCSISAEEYEDDISCYGNIDRENETIVIITKDALTKNFACGYLHIGDVNDSSSILVGGDLALDLIKNWSGVQQNVNIGVQYGLNEDGPWYDREIEVLDDLLESEVLYEIYVKVDATTNAGKMKSVIMTQNKNQVASGVNGFVYRVKSNTNDSTKFSIVAESESRISVEKIIGISTLGESGKKDREIVRIGIQYGLSENGPWYSKESEILNDVLEGEKLTKMYIKASATTNTGSITNMKISRSGREVKKGTNDLIFEVTSNTAENTMFYIEAKSSTGEIICYTLEIFSIGQSGKKEKQEISIGVQYGASENGPWYNNEIELLNDIKYNQKIKKIYVNAQAKIDRGSIRSVTIGQNGNDLKNGVNSVIYGISSNTTGSTKFYIRAESNNGTEKIIYLDITKIGSSGIKSEDKITISIRYGLDEDGPWFNTENEMLNEVLENEKVDKVYVEVIAETESGIITNLIIKDGDRELRSRTSGILIQEFNKNTTQLLVEAKSSKGVIKSLSGAVSCVGAVGIREDITVSIFYAISNNGTWYNKESQLLIQEGESDKEYIKIAASSNKKAIQSIEIKYGDNSIALADTYNMLHCFEENIDGLLVVVTSSSGKVVTQSVSISGIKKNESYITITVKYGITESGPWRINQGDILNDIKNTDIVNQIYIKAIAEVNIGSISNISIHSGLSNVTKTASVIVHKFSTNTVGNAISITATDNNGNTKTWVGDITQIGSYGTKNSAEYANDGIIQDITEDFSSIDWDIRKSIDWRNDLVSEKELLLKYEDTNVPEIIVSKVVGNSDIVMVSIKTRHDGEAGYDIRYRLANKVEDKSLSEISFGNWQVYNGPFTVSTNTYVEAEGRYNESNFSYRSAIEIVNIEEINSAMYIVEDRNLPLTINKQYLIAYYEDTGSSKYYKKDNGSKISFGSGNMFIIEVDKGKNATITLGETSNSVSQDSVAYVIDNAISMSLKKTSTSLEESRGKYKYEVRLEPGSKITDTTIKEVGIIGEYTLGGTVNGIVKKTNSINGKNGIFTFEICNAPSSITCKAYYINEDNEMIMI